MAGVGNSLKELLKHDIGHFRYSARVVTKLTRV